MGRLIMRGALNVTGGVRYPSGYWIPPVAASPAPESYVASVRADWLEWVEEERERWYASLPSGAPPEWNARGMASVLSSRPGGAWAGSAASVQTLVSTELAEYWTDVAPRLNLAQYAAMRLAEAEAEANAEWERYCMAEYGAIPF